MSCNLPSLLSTDINVITAEINAYQRMAGEAIFEIGRRLKHVKKNDLIHGEWTKWCETIKMSRSQAQRFIRVYERFGNRPPGDAQLSVTILDTLISYDDEELDTPREMPDGSTKKLTEMSRREIEDFKRNEANIIKERENAIRAANEADRRAKEAEGYSKLMEDENQQLEKQLTLKQKSEEILQQQLTEAQSKQPKTIEKTVEVEKIVHVEKEVDKTDYESIEVNGIHDPIKCTTAYTVISGHQRLRIAKELGFTEVPVSIVDVDEWEAEYLLIAENVERRGQAESDSIKKSRIGNFLKEYWGVKNGVGRNLGQNGLGDIANFIEETERTTQRLLKLNDLIPEIQQLVSSGKLGTTAAEQYGKRDCAEKV